MRVGLARNAAASQCTKPSLPNAVQPNARCGELRHATLLSAPRKQAGAAAGCCTNAHATLCAARRVRQGRSAAELVASGAPATTDHWPRRGPVHREAARASEALQGATRLGRTPRRARPPLHCAPFDAVALVPQEREEPPRLVPVRRSRPAPFVQSSADALQVRMHPLAVELQQARSHPRQPRVTAAGLCHKRRQRARA